MAILVRHRTALLAALLAVVLGLQISALHVGATGGTVTLPSGVDSGLVTTGVALFATIGAAAVAVVLGVKALPLATRYVFMWLRMAVSRR